MPEFITAVGDDSITRFDNPERKRSKSRRRGQRQNGGRKGDSRRGHGRKGSGAAKEAGE
jgi:hypothetical protein